MINKGIAPPDMTSPVGKVRGLLGDVEYSPLDPDEPGYGNYALYSDAEIEAFLGQSDDSVEGAIYWAHMQMAGAAAREAKNIQDFDLRVNTEKRAEYLLSIAREWKERWDSQTADIFEVFDVVQPDPCVPELAAWPVTRCL